MINILILLVFVFACLLHIVIRRRTLKRTQIIDLVLIYSLVFLVGVEGTIGFISHVFFANQTAQMIGWPIGSPFQFEVGFHDGAWGLLGFFCLRWRGAFLLATGLGWSFFLLGATYGHIYQMILHGDYSPYNAGMILPDLITPIILLTLLYVKFRKGVQSI